MIGRQSDFLDRKNNLLLVNNSFTLSESKRDIEYL